MNSKNIIIALIIILVVAIGGWYFVFNNKTPQYSKMGELEMNPNVQMLNGSPALEASNNQVTAPVVEKENVQSTVKEFTVEGTNYKFVPDTILVNKGDTVKINFKNTQGFHDFVVDEFGAATKQIKDPSTETITFVADKVGTFEYYCSVGKHRTMGMKGTLTVK